MAEQVSFVGQRLGNYVLVRLLGQGGFAEVYLGEHVHLKTLAAVKLLHTRLAQDDIEGFRREAQTIARLVHPHIVRVLDFGVEGHAPYLVMDYAPHGTLRTRHARGTRVALPDVAQYVRQVAEALDFAHAQRLIHRDIKPENMLVGRNGEILLSDFGIALASQSSSYQHTQDVAGTIAYMAPEQIQAHPRPASDQYALGIVIYEWLSGNRPFQGTYTEVAIKHTMAPPPPLRGQIPDLPPGVEEVVMRALQKDPRQRFEDVRSLAAALEQACFKRGYDGMPGPASWQGSIPTSSQLSSYPTVVPAAPQTHSRYQQGHAGSPGIAPQFSRYHAQPVAPYNGLPGAQSPMPYAAAAPQVQPQRRLSRRAAVGGLLLAAAAGGAAWYARRFTHYDSRI
jgi:serine/threonine protein kinase